VPILSDGRGPKWLPVDQVHYRRHEGKSGVPSMKVSYQCGLRTFHEWVCVEHTGFARSKAAAWWNMRSTLPTPRTVDEAVAESRHSLPTPKRIMVRESGKYPEIINHDFAHDLRSQTPDSRDVARVGFRS
jgi:DNA repair protein RadD